MLGVLRNEFLFIGGHFVHDEDGISWAHRNACAAVDAAIGVHVKLGRRFEAFLVLLGMNTVGRTSFDAKFVFGAGIGDDVRMIARSLSILLPSIRPAA